LKERLSPYVFKTVWRKGKSHSIPDALSRAPVNDPSADDVSVVGADSSFVRAVVMRRIGLIGTENSDSGEAQQNSPRDLLLEEIRSAATRDSGYAALIDAVSTGFPARRDQTDPAVRQYWVIREELSTDDGLVFYGSRVIVPAEARRSILSKLHASHQGIVRTRQRAAQTVYWSGINNDIVQMVERCQPCQEHRPSLPKEPLMADPRPEFVFQSVSADLFQAGSLYVLVYADRLSGWTVVHQWRHLPSSKEVIRAIIGDFVDLGIPQRFRSDGGTQFSSREFRGFLDRWKVEWCPSTPTYAQSNGHAEATVKSVKHLVLKCASSGDLSSEEFLQGLLELRNTPDATGFSPAQIVFGHQLRSIVPAHRSSFQPRWTNAMEARDRQAAIDAIAKGYYDEHSRTLRPLKLGELVRVQDDKTKLWDRVGTVVSIGHRRDYRVKTESGSVMWRNRRFIRPQRPPKESPLPAPAASVASHLVAPDAGTPSAAPKPPVNAEPTRLTGGRHSSRSRKAPDRLNL